jgi:hypothetical protein
MTIRWTLRVLRSRYDHCSHLTTFLLYHSFHVCSCMLCFALNMVRASHETEME